MDIFNRNKIPILMYHSVLAANKEAGEASCLTLAGMTVGVERFCAQMTYIARHHNTISFQELVDWRLGAGLLPPNPCVISFDDGLMDAYENAVPILRELRLKATFFIIGQSLTSSRPSWLHRAYDILDSQPVAESISALREEVPGFPTGEGFDKARLRARAKENLMRLEPGARRGALDRLESRSNVRGRGNRTRFVEPRHVAALANEGFEVGSHSMRHEYLAWLSDEELDEDVRESKRVLADNVGCEPRAFCYPYGGRDSCDERVKSALRKYGFTSASTAMAGLNDTDTDLLALRRIPVTEMPGAAFALLLSGVSIRMSRLAAVLGRRGQGRR
jgi:peptidoglycan/xylan/chitin deacetylase (PgdA/CDA1 family)